MPTPVSTARQCLTPEAAHALDEAVRVAKKRGHGQTTSLHAVSALLSFPSSILRDACSRARNSAYSTRLQFKALDLCLSVSLDRVPSGGVSGDGGESPPVSNSLMAAIKRSQANQRRQPESFHLYHQFSSQNINFNQLTSSSSPSSSSSSVSCIRVDLRNLIMSILDDPVVSRVFSDAGFRSSEIKLAVFRPIPTISYSNPGRKGFTYQFPGFPGFFSGNENFRRIGEVLRRSQGRNPLLLGVCACDELACFVDLLEKKKNNNILPSELSGLSVIRFESEISQFLTLKSSNPRDLDPRLEEVGRTLDRDPGPGLVLSFGDLEAFVKIGDGGVSYVVEKLTTLLQNNSNKLWLIGAAASYETYSKFVGRFPCVVKDWDLQLLPITSVTRASSIAAESSYPKSSLMESFVPFGGFFSAPSDFKVPLGSSPYQYVICSERREQDRASGAIMADQYQPPGLPCWLQTPPELATVKWNNDMKIRDDKDVLSCRAASLQIEQEFMNPPKFPTIMGFQLEQETDSTTFLKATSSVTIDSQQMLTSDSAVKLSNEDTDSGGGALNSSMCYGSQASPSSVNSMTMDLGLRISSAPPVVDPKTSLLLPCHQDIRQELSLSFSGVTDVNGSVSDHNAAATATRSSQSSSRLIPRYAACDFKYLLQYLSERVGWQNEAIRVISETIADCRTRGRNIWFSFLGPDWCGKRKVAAAMAEIIYGTKENFVYANLDPQFGVKDSILRGKTVADYVAGELCRRPISVVLLENVDKADVQVQNSLSRAIQTGKFSDSHGREVSISNAIIITTTSTESNDILLSQKLSTYSEDKVARAAKGCTIRILIEKNAEKQLGQDLTLSVNNGNKSNSIFKRKLTGGMNQTIAMQDRQEAELVKRAHKQSTTRVLDLNLPAQENDLPITEGENLDHDHHHSKAWLRGFYGRVDRVVEFKPFDFDALANRIMNEIKKCFHKFINVECGLDIEPKVMEKLVGTAYLSNNESRMVEDLVEQVLGREFAEVRRKHGELNDEYTLKVIAREGFDVENVVGITTQVPAILHSLASTNRYEQLK